ncbi:unnamed protein product, partial [marine sediment metagenome]
PVFEIADGWETNKHTKEVLDLVKRRRTSRG